MKSIPGVDSKLERMLPCENCGAPVRCGSGAVSLPQSLAFVVVCNNPECQSHIERAPVHGKLDDDNFQLVYTGPRREKEVAN